MTAAGSPWTVRRAVEPDLPGILACLAAAFEPFRAEYTPAAFLDTTLTPDSVVRRFRAMSIWVAHDGAGVVRGTLGWARTSARSGHLRGMAVDPAWQGSGVAQALLDHVLGEMRASGATHVTLRTTPPLERAVRFYERNGFRATGRVLDFFGMPVVERARDLGPAAEPGDPRAATTADPAPVPTRASSAARRSTPARREGARSPGRGRSGRPSRRARPRRRRRSRSRG